MKAAAAQNLFENDLIQSAPESRTNYPRYNLSGGFIDALRRRSSELSITGKIHRHIETLFSQLKGGVLLAYEKNRRAV